MARDQKAMLGHRMRRLRRELGLTQAQMAEELGISASYLNLVEHNQRPLTVPLLLKLGQTYDIDLTSFAEDDEAQLVTGLREVFGDPLLAGADIKAQDLRDLAAASPQAAQAIQILYRHYREGQDTLRALGEKLEGSGGQDAVEMEGFPVEAVRDFFAAAGNHFPELETAAEALWADAALTSDSMTAGLAEHLVRAHGLKVQVMPLEVMTPALRRLDRHSRRVLLSEVLPPQARAFHLASQIAQLALPDAMTQLARAGGLTAEPAQRLARLNLAAYFAAAVLMPYDRFAAAARTCRHDLDLLAARFGTSIEQVSHRLTTLQRPGNKGVPFFMLRLDRAGNVTKRFAAAGFQFARFGGACPRWHVHDSFMSPGAPLRQVVAMPDGTLYLSLARAASRPGGALPQAIALGCDIRHAAQVIYADGLDLARAAEWATAIGPGCRLCERTDCPDRAHPPLGQRIEIYEHHRGTVPFNVEGPGL